MILPKQVDDLRQNGRTIAIRHNVNTVRITVIDHDGFDETEDREWLLGDFSTALLRTALEDPTTTTIPVQKKRRRWFW